MKMFGPQYVPYGVVAVVFTLGCTPKSSVQPDGALWVATIPPIAQVVERIAGDHARVLTLLPLGASAHSYAPRPSDVRQVEAATGLFYVADNLDGWIIRYAADKAVPLMPLVSADARLPADKEHGGEGEWDPHFWTDPAVMATVVPQIARIMAGEDPPGAEVYLKNAAAFVEQLEALDQELRDMLAPVQGRAVMLVHPSLAYFLHRYAIPVAGYVEPMPGRKPSPQDLEALITTAKDRHVRAIFSEVQLPRQSIEAVAEALGLPVFELDPLGGPGRESYEALLRYNAVKLLEGLQ